MLRAQSIVGGSLNSTQTYTYDAVNKVKDASESGTGTWLETYRYNNTSGTVGNLWVEPDSPLRTGLPKLTSETAQGTSWYTGRNRLNLWDADDSGNVTGVHSMLRTFKYDAENRQTSATIDDVKTTYRYDGLGQRVQKIAGTTTTTYVYDAGGNLAAEYSTAIVASGCGTAVCYVTTDHLGSTRLLTDANGNPAKRYDYSPFGVELFVGTGGRSVADGYTSSTDGFNPKFTGQMRDSETGLDFFNARYYSPAQGRFQSPDPGNAGADLANPQTWNMYAYVNNSPLNYTDPTGQFIAVGVGAAVGGPPGAAIGGIATGLGALFRWIFGGGGGNHGELAPLADVLSRSVDVSGLSGGWWSNCGFLFGTVCGIGPSDELLPTFYAEAIGDMPVPGQGKATKPVAGTTGSYTSLDCAGYQAATAFLPQTNKTGLEHGGYIYKGSRGTFSYSAPIVGTPTSIPSFYTALSKPNGVSIAGWYHTHPLVPGYTNEAFSGYDLGVSRKLNVPGYLGAASGRVLKLTPKGDGITTRVGTGACRVN